MALDQSGKADLNFKFEMKTYFEAAGNKYKEKPGIMTIFARDASSNSESMTIGSAPVNWADFVERKMHKN